MRGRHHLPVFLAYTAASLLLLGYLARQMGGEFMFASVYRVSAVFATGSELVAGDDVTISGLRVGKVESLSPRAQGADVQLVIHSEYAPVFNDARAVIHSKNLLGETYVELHRGHSHVPLPSGARLGLERTLSPVELDQVLDVLGPEVRTRLAILINTLGQTTAGRGTDLGQQAADLKVLATSLETIASSLSQSSVQLDSLLVSLRKVLQTLAAWHAEFKALITDWDRLMRTLASREQELMGTIREQDRVMAIFDQVLSGGAARDLHDAIAESPAALDNADHYLTRGTQIFPRVSREAPSISALFFELASVMSNTDSEGNHMWRVYNEGASFPGSTPQP
jgi:phospholipid/cholesterol/gamma-HCH transport system substrate-binding protein